MSDIIRRNYASTYNKISEKFGMNCSNNIQLPQEVIRAIASCLIGLVNYGLLEDLAKTPENLAEEGLFKVDQSNPTSTVDVYFDKGGLNDNPIRIEFRFEGPITCPKSITCSISIGSLSEKTKSTSLISLDTQVKVLVNSINESWTNCFSSNEDYTETELLYVIAQLHNSNNSISESALLRMAKAILLIISEGRLSGLPEFTNYQDDDILTYLTIEQLTLDDNNLVVKFKLLSYEIEFSLPVIGCSIFYYIIVTEIDEDNPTTVVCRSTDVLHPSVKGVIHCAMDVKKKRTELANKKSMLDYVKERKL